MLDFFFYTKYGLELTLVTVQINNAGVIGASASAEIDTTSIKEEVSPLNLEDHCLQFNGSVMASLLKRHYYLSARLQLAVAVVSL